MNRRALLLILLVACNVGSPPTPDVFAPVIAEAEASGRQANCAGGGGPVPWHLCLVLTDGVLTVVPAGDTPNIEEGVTVIVKLENVTEPLEADMASLPSPGIPWAGDSFEVQILDKSGNSIGFFMGHFQSTD